MKMELKILQASHDVRSVYIDIIWSIYLTEKCQKYYPRQQEQDVNLAQQQKNN